jgi:hypothetical protein
MKSELEQIPGIGKIIAKNLARIDIYKVEDFKGQDPEELYEKWCLEALYPSDTDRCVLYVFRNAVYYANGGRDPEKLKWNYWKDNGGSRKE